MGVVYKAACRPGLTVIRSKVTDMAEAVKADRNTYIGGSDAGAIFGLNPWKSPYALWCEKTGKISGYVPDNDAMRTGRDLEQYVAERFEDATGKKVRKDNFRYTLREYPFMVGHIDRSVVGENAILECKTANSYQNSNYENGIFPDHYYVQCQHYMAVTGCDRVYLGVLCFPHFYMKEYDRDEREIAALLSAESTFWDNVMNDSPPDADGSESTTDALTERYGNGGFEGSINLNQSDHTMLLEELNSIKQEIIVMESLKAERENQLKEILGNNEYGLTRDWKVSWKPQKRTSIDSARLKKERPDIYEHYSKETETRVLRVTPIRRKDEEDVGIKE